MGYVVIFKSLGSVKVTVEFFRVLRYCLIEEGEPEWIRIHWSVQHE